VPGRRDPEAVLAERPNLDGSEVVAIMRGRAKLRASDAVLERDLPTVWTIRDGVCVRYRVLPSRNDALKAVELKG
jgi:hypothetical protein